MKSSVKKILAILAGMKCWVVITLVGTPQRRQKAHSSVSICPSNLLSSETPSTTHRDTPKGRAPLLIIASRSSRVNQSLQGPVLGRIWQSQHLT